jgi:hypothetical protein
VKQTPWYLFVWAVVAVLSGWAFSPLTPVCAGAPSSVHVLQVGEELEYGVRYSFFHVGTIRMKVTGKEIRNGRTVYFATAEIVSNPSLEWLLRLHVRISSEMDEDVFSYGWISEDTSRTEINYERMRFDYKTKTMQYDWGKKGNAHEFRAKGTKIVPITGYSQDGLSLFYYAREHARREKKEDVPTFIDSSVVSTMIHFSDVPTDESIDAAGYPIDVVPLIGNASFTGIFGLTGGFSGKFTNDDARIPVTAKLSVLLGSVKIELLRWKRGIWAPPAYGKKP